MRKGYRFFILGSFLFLVLFFGLCPAAIAKGNLTTFEVDPEQCVLKVCAEESTLKKLKILIEKNGEKYYYDILRKEESLPLQMGAGNYEIAVLEHIEGCRYRYIQRGQVILYMEYDFLASVQNIPWRGCPNVTKKARELIDGWGSDKDKLRKIHQFIINEISYWHIPGRVHIPNPEEILQTGCGNCYDYSSLFAAMLRSIGIPCKLVIGYVDGYKGLHAWNEVLVGGEWMIIDTTFDAVRGGMGERVGYWKEREY